MTPLVLLVLLAVVVWAHEIAVLRRARSASETLNNKERGPRVKTAGPLTNTARRRC